MEIKNVREHNGTEFFSIKTDDGIELHGCSIKDGSKGKFVAVPSRKGNDGKWYPHFYLPHGVQKIIIKLMESEPDEPVGKDVPGFDDDSIPF